MVGVSAGAGDTPPQGQLEQLIERQLRNADQALGSRPGGAAPRHHATRYDLALLNVESRFELPRIVQALRARGHGSLCFYCPPGSGKTALAEYLAEQMGRPLMIRQASDLVSKFIGETEQNMADMYAEAERENAVLLLDEADSYLQDRRGAQRTYEVTEVNEMLQGMERHKGVFICTTNLMDRIDQAALRRFTFKIRFKSLSREQRRAMFVAEVLGGQADRLRPAQQQQLDALDQLCLGDFAAVQRQAQILGEDFGPDEFLAQLEAEHRLKPEVRESRGMGFMQ
jgi:SpoVK/Ycf46/Vps4 family AAA+-type ATPase